MSKAILILDKMPVSCEDCECSFEKDYTFCAITGRANRFLEKPEWCPLVPMPDKPDYPPINECSYVAGWNACIDAICAAKGKKE